MVRDTITAVIVGGLLGLIVALVLVFAVWHACSLDAWRGGLVLECVATDPIRMWPWPMVQPWGEDDNRPQTVDGGLVREPGQIRGPGQPAKGTPHGFTPTPIFLIDIERVFC